MPIPNEGNPSPPTRDTHAQPLGKGPVPPLELRILAAPVSGTRDLGTRIFGVIIVFILSCFWAPWLRERPQNVLAGIHRAQEIPDTLLPIYERAVIGDTGAMRMMGSTYYHGLTVPQDTQEGLRWYRRAAAAGDAEAARVLEQLRLHPETEEGAPGGQGRGPQD